MFEEELDKGTPVPSLPLLDKGWWDILHIPGALQGSCSDHKHALLTAQPLHAMKPTLA